MPFQPGGIGPAADHAGQGDTQPTQGGSAVRRTGAVLAGLDLQATGAMAQAHPGGGLVGMLATRTASALADHLAATQQRGVVDDDLSTHCGVPPGDIWCVRMIVAHLPDGVCRIRITTEPMFSRSEFVPMVLESMLDGEQRLIVDLGLVSMLHSPSLANLVTIHITLAKRSSEMILTGLHDKNLRILEITKLDRLFTIQPNI